MNNNHNDRKLRTETTALARWNKSDGKARVRIGLSVEDDQLIHIKSVKTAKQAWTTLKEYHQKATLTSKVLLLKRLCRTVLSDDGNMEAHISGFSHTVNQLTALGTELDDNLLAAMLLGSLPESYDTLVRALESRPEKNITSQLIKSTLIDEYKRRKGQKDFRENLMSKTAMKTTYSNNSGQKKYNNNSRQEGRSCYFCKNPGHIKPDCIKYKAWKSKNGNQANAVKEDSTTTGEKLFITVECVFTKQYSILFAKSIADKSNR